MRSFRDTLGRVWTVRIDIAAIKRVRSLAGVDLLEAASTDGLGAILSDPIKVCDSLYALCADEAKVRSVSDEDFGRALCGDEIEAATAALAEELIDFFPSVNRGPLRKWLAAVKAVQTRLMERADRELAAVDPDEIAEAIVARQTSGSPSGGLPALPESTLTL